MTAVGVASPSPQGQATTRTEMPKRREVTRGCRPCSSCGTAPTWKRANQTAVVASARA
eukprot:CAMPEP_0118991338 /NCGR_PEP_ID=MMETSP1173-20130426/51482_1 /TAXON_ID=1034831 /ORGANISM="Rhizochromulina marina cf, Strain CCMP1243" /LENGTH=57 /DNA_ID=CAMNT_0006942457 /DNA_START=10 /DNA_END=179 /DNA_ORIENTATION=+